MVFSGRPPLVAVLEGLTLATPGDRDGGGLATRSSISEGSISSGTPSRVSPQGQGSYPPRGESPASFNDLLAQATTVSNQGGKKYRLWCLPVDSKEVCMGLIGAGASFCTIRGCTKTHRNQNYHLGSPGEAYVAKNSEAAFVEPSLDTRHLSPSLLNSWKDLLITLEEWTSLFSLAQVEDEQEGGNREVKFSLDDIKVKDEEETTAMAFKTPRKRKYLEPQSPSMLMPVFENLITEGARPFDLKVAESYINELDRRSIQLREIVTAWTSRSDRQQNDALSFYHSTDVKLNRLSSSVGRKPTTLDPRFDAPNVWLSLATITDELNTAQHFQFGEIKDLKREMLMKVPESKFQLHQEEVVQRMNELEGFAIASTKRLQENIMKMVDSFSSNQMESSTSMSSIELMQRLEKMEREIKLMKSMNDESSVKYSNLGFNSQKDSDAWIEANLPSDDYGLLMDFNLVFEHVYTQLAGQKILTKLESIYKMKLSNNNQAVALTSFETRIPKVFCGESRSVVMVRDGESYFKSIKSWEEWNTPNDGYRDQIKRELTVFEIGDKETLEAELEPLSIFHTLCSKSLTDAVSWGQKLIKFIDDTYREYSRARYSSKKAWHVSTKLAVALMEYVAKPRNVVHNSFRISNSLSVAKAVSYAHFRSLDLMTKVDVLEFKNSPIVTAELAKFLALNSSFESVEKLQSNVTDMTDKISKAVKEANTATKSASTVGNSVDGIKVELKGIVKRLKTLEGGRS